MVGLTGDKSFPVGSIVLTITSRLIARKVTNKVVFLVVNCPSAYNVILGRPSFYQMKAITSTYHLMMRFPIDHGVGEVRGD